MDHFADRLTSACRTKGNSVCVGLDPRWESLPDEIRHRHGGETLEAVARAYEEFCSRVIDIVAPLVPVVKPQSAFFEACGPGGMAALQRILAKARQQGLISILDGKRNDIASTASAYADAGLGGVRIEDRRSKIEDRGSKMDRRADDQSSILDPPSSLIHAVWDADAMTVNPYLGRDAIEPFLESARKSGRGIFVLVRTSNPGAGQFQDLVCDGRPLFVHVAEAVGQWSRENLAKCGLGDVGAVVGATYPAELQDLRKMLAETPLLVPGFGFQGGAVQDVAAAFREDGLGAIINSSRGIISCFSPSDTKWERAVEKATRQTIRALTENTNMGRLRS
jgi:orotidine-5'-phosphate decarboxylase